MEKTDLFCPFYKKKNVKKYKMVDITFCYNCSLAAFYFHYFAYIYLLQLSSHTWSKNGKNRRIITKL